jgi:hypothetical protein
MNRLIIIITITFFFIAGCHNQKDKSNNDISQICNAVSINTANQIFDLEKLNLTAPKRYHQVYLQYNDFYNKYRLINHLLEYHLENNKYKLSHDDLQEFQDLYSLIDSIYLTRISITIRNGKDTITELTKLNKYLDPLKYKTLNSSKKYDIELLRLYLVLINREVISFIHTYALEGTLPITSMETVTVHENGLLNCYITCMDSCSFPMILIGKFDHIKDSEGIYYKEKQIFDTVYFSDGKAVIDPKTIGGNEAILYYLTSYGYTVKRKIK